MSALRRADQFIQLNLHGLIIAILGILNEEDHQKRDDGRGRVDRKLPRVAVAKDRPRNAPERDEEQSQDECVRLPGEEGNPSRKGREGLFGVLGGEEGNRSMAAHG